MKMIAKFLLVIMAMGIAGPAAGAELNELIIVTEDHEDFPNVIGNSSEINSERPGAAIEAMNMLGKKLGIQIRYKRVPWKRALEMELQHGRAQGLLTASYKKEREQFGAYPVKNGQVDPARSLFSNTYIFYKRKDSPVSYDGGAIMNLKRSIGGPRGYSVVADLRKQGYDVEESDSTLTDMKKLMMKRIDLVVALELTGDKILKNHAELNAGIDKIEAPFSTKEYYLLLSNQFVQAHPELAGKIWNMVGEIRNSQYRELAEKYLD